MLDYECVHRCVGGGFLCVDRYLIYSRLARIIDAITESVPSRGAVSAFPIQKPECGTRSNIGSVD